MPNPYEAPRWQETDSPAERIVPLFSAERQATRRPSLATCSVGMSVGWGLHVTAPHTYGGSSAMGMAVTESMRLVLGALEPSLDPHTVLGKRRAAHLCAPVRLRCGGGAAPGHHQGLALSGQEREQASKHTHGGRATGLWAHQRSLTHAGPHGRARWAGAPPDAPVRRPARRGASLTPGARRRARTRRAVATYQRAPGPVYGPRSSGPCPARIGSRGAPDSCGPQDCGGATGRPLRKQPM